jgi:hypothetical protein
VGRRNEKKDFIRNKGVYESWVGAGRDVGPLNLDKRHLYGWIRGVQL